MSPKALLHRAARPTLENIRADRQRMEGVVATSLRYLEDHLFSRGLDVNQWKRACGIQEGAFTLRFHRDLELPPKAYLTQRRLETAARLLRETDLQIWRIADMVGYSSPTVFTKAFRRWAGRPPSALRVTCRSTRSLKIGDIQCADHV